MREKLAAALHEASVYGIGATSDFNQRVILQAARENSELLAAIKAMVAEQASDEGLWFMPETCAEAYVQQKLRKLHAAIEGKTPEQCAHEALARWAETE